MKEPRGDATIVTATTIKPFESKLLGGLGTKLFEDVEAAGWKNSSPGSV